MWSLPVAANWLWGHLYVSLLPIFSTNRETGMEWMRGKGFTNKTNNRRAKNKVTSESHILTRNQDSSSQHHNNLPDINRRCWSDTHVRNYIHTQKCSLHYLGVTSLGHSPQIISDSQQAVGRQHITEHARKKHGHHLGLAVSKPWAQHLRFSPCPFNPPWYPQIHQTLKTFW